MSARILITGAAQGMGRAFTEYFAGRGNRLLAVDIQDVPVDLPGVRAAKCDVTDPESLAEVVGIAQREWGGLDGVVANAAIFDGVVRAPIEEITLSEYARVMDVNVKGVWLTVRAALPALRAAGGGSIVTLASEVVNAGSVNLSHYVASKGAVVGLTRALARELGPEKIRVNCMIPGWVMTERQMRLWLTPEGERQIEDRQCLKDRLYPPDIARMALFLAADDSRMCSSQNFIVDGGWV